MCECKQGFYGDGIGMCAKGQCNDRSCPVNKKCVSATRTDCECKEGYEIDQSNNCIDIDECSLSGFCDINAKCMNTVASYACSCKGNFTGDGQNCDCKIGYSKHVDTDGNEMCLDIDECLELNDCHENADCQNLIPSYECSCKKTFIAEGRNCNCPKGFNQTTVNSESVCIDIDDCASKDRG